MYVAITLRFEKSNETYTISKKFKEIFDKLGITLIPILQTSNLDEIINMCQALILTGSPIHVEESLYNGAFQKTYTREDEIDYLLIAKFHQQNKPILGICRGIQILNVYFGGTLKKVLNHEGLKHEINISSKTILSDLYGFNTLVNSTHCQAVDKVADGFKVIALSKDKVVEAIQKDNIIGVQWHPEKLDDYQFFAKFFATYCK